jgi:hypothetical protein
VERLIRDLKGFLRVTPVTSLQELKAKVFSFEKERNSRTHRTTKKTPVEMLAEEKLRPLPRIEARPYRRLPAAVTKTAFVEFDTNRYSVPTSYAGTAAEILALPDTVEILVQAWARRSRSFYRPPRTRAKTPSRPPT